MAKLEDLLKSLTLRELENLKLMMLDKSGKESPAKLFFNELEENGWIVSEVFKQTIFQRLYPGQIYQDIKIRLLKSDLLKKVEQYLVNALLSPESYEYQLHLAEIYKQKGLKKYADQIHHRLEKKNRELPYRNADHYWRQMILGDKLGQTNDPETIQRQFSANNLAFISAIMRNSYPLLANSSVFNTQFDFGILPSVIEYIEKENLLELPTIRIYYDYYHMVTTQDEKYFHRVFSNMMENFRQFPQTELRDLFMVVNNYSIKKLNEGNKDYEVISLDLYKLGLEMGVLLENNLMSNFTYTNITALAIKNQEINWTKKFIETYKPHLAPDQREELYKLSLARIYYVTREYERASAQLLNIHFKSLLFNLVSKSLLAKIYFESKDWSLLEYHLLAMKAYIYRQKRIGYHKKAFLNFIRYLEELIKWDYLNPVQKQKIRSRFIAENSIAEKEWLESMF